ncbi:hypothetical protein ACLOJK_039479 [Asimina triloba]
MEVSPIQTGSWPSYLISSFLFPSYAVAQNYVHWAETTESHLFSADLPGVRKEEIRVEVEDSRYLIIRTETEAVEVDGPAPAMRFMRKFRLPERVDVDGISAGYEDGVLTVTVPRLFARGRFRIHPADLPPPNHLLARAA